MEITADEAVELLAQAAAGIPIDVKSEKFKQACFVGKDALERLVRGILQEGVLKKVADNGLFLVHLKNGDWMCGKASLIYDGRISILDDQYADPNLFVSSSLIEAVNGAIENMAACKTAENSPPKI